VTNHIIKISSYISGTAIIIILIIASFFKTQNWAQPAVNALLLLTVLSIVLGYAIKKVEELKEERERRGKK
jgi:uncharacterized membrane protein YbhN (UPF0104 family)